jgi:hypothetical protein
VHPRRGFQAMLPRTVCEYGDMLLCPRMKRKMHFRGAQTQKKLKAVKLSEGPKKNRCMSRSSPRCSVLQCPGPACEQARDVARIHYQETELVRRKRIACFGPWRSCAPQNTDAGSPILILLIFYVHGVYDKLTLVSALRSKLSSVRAARKSHHSKKAHEAASGNIHRQVGVRPDYALRTLLMRWINWRCAGKNKGAHIFWNPNPRCHHRPAYPAHEAFGARPRRPHLATAGHGQAFRCDNVAVSLWC